MKPNSPFNASPLIAATPVTASLQAESMAGDASMSDLRGRFPSQRQNMALDSNEFDVNIGNSLTEKAKKTSSYEC